MLHCASVPMVDGRPCKYDGAPNLARERRNGAQLPAGADLLIKLAQNEATHSPRTPQQGIGPKDLFASPPAPYGVQGLLFEARKGRGRACNRGPENGKVKRRQPPEQRQEAPGDNHPAEPKPAALEPISAYPTASRLLQSCIDVLLAFTDAALSNVGKYHDESAEPRQDEDVTLCPVSGELATGHQERSEQSV